MALSTRRRAAQATPQPANPAQGVSGLTISNLQRAHVERQEEWCPDQKPDLSFRGNEMAGEVGEACNVIKKLERERQGWRGSRATKEQLAEELADVVHTAVLCAITAGIDLEPAVFDKFNATSKKNGLASHLTAAIGAGGQAVAFGWVTEADPYSRYGSAVIYQRRDESIGATIPLYAHPPHPADERVDTTGGVSNKAEEGRQAYKNGQSKDSNPYPQGSARYWQWSSGWLDERAFRPHPADEPRKLVKDIPETEMPYHGPFPPSAPADERVVEALREAIEPFRFAAEAYKELNAAKPDRHSRPHDFVTTEEFDVLRAALAQEGRKNG